MIKRALFIFVGVCFCAQPLFADITDDVKGRTWLKMDRRQRLIYLKGVYAGMRLADVKYIQSSPDKNIVAETMPDYNDYRKTQEAMRKFYVPVRTHDIPASIGLVVRRMEADGASQAEIDQFIEACLAYYPDEA